MQMQQMIGSMSRRMVNGQLWGPLLRKPGTQQQNQNNGSEQEQTQHLPRNSGFLEGMMDQSPAVGALDGVNDMSDDAMMLGSPAPAMRRFSQPNVPVMGGEPVIQGEDQVLLRAVPSLRVDRTPLGSAPSNPSSHIVPFARDLQNHLGTFGFTLDNPSPMIVPQNPEDDAEDSCSPVSDFEDDFVTPLQGLSLETPRVLNAEHVAVMSPPQIKLGGSMSDDVTLDLQGAFGESLFDDSGPNNKEQQNMFGRNLLVRKKEDSEDESESMQHSRSKSRRRLMSADSNEEFKQFHQARVARGAELPQVSTTDIDRATAAHTIAQQIVRWSETLQAQVIPDEVYYEGKNPVLYSAEDDSHMMSGSDESIEFSESDVLYRETQDEHIKAALELPKYARDAFLKADPSLLSQTTHTLPETGMKDFSLSDSFQEELSGNLFSIPPAAAAPTPAASQRTTRFALR